MNITEHNGTLKQKRMIQALLRSGSVKGACKSAKVGRTTFYRWMKDDTFRDALRTAESELIETESIALLAVMEACRMILFKIASTGESENQRRLSALNLYELALRMRENFELEERLTRLENLHNEREEKDKRFGRR